jgi:hypothetical protein
MLSVGRRAPPVKRACPPKGQGTIVHHFRLPMTTVLVQAAKSRPQSPWTKGVSILLPKGGRFSAWKLGHWARKLSPQECSHYTRYDTEPWRTSPYIGFRVVCEVSEQQSDLWSCRIARGSSLSYIRGC